MRVLVLWRMFAVLLLVAGCLALPVVDDRVAVVVADDDDDDDDNGRDDDDDDDDNGRDDDDDDDDNGRDDDDDDNGRDDDKDKKDKKDKDREPVEAAAAFGVEASCEFSSDDDRTECLFTPIAPDGGGYDDRLHVPASAVCAGVIGGDFLLVDDAANPNLAGYTSRDEDGELTLIIEGEATLAGMATYWFETDDGVFPGTGPGLDCGEAASSPGSPSTAGATPPPEEGLGAVMVVTFACADVPEDKGAFDWYGACGPGETGHQFELEPVGVGSDAQTVETSSSGEAIFEGLVPGTYDLDDTGAVWCHAESDNVNAEGDVMVEADERTMVWLFYCEAGGGS